MDKFQISTMTLKDFENIQDIFTSDFDSFWNPSILKQELLCDNSYFIVAKNKSEIIGFAGFKALLDTADLMNIVVKKSYRNQGIGSLLLKELMHLFYSFSLSSLYLEVNENNFPAIRLYQKFGFKKIDVRKNYYPNHQNAIIMCFNTK